VKKFKLKYFLIFLFVAGGIAVFSSFFGIYSLQDGNGKHYYFINKVADFQTGDLVVIQSPDDSVLRKIRLIACPNDVVEIIDGEIYVNDKLLNINRTYKYRVNCFNDEATDLLKNKYHYIQQINVLGVYDCYLNKCQADSLLLDSLFVIKKYNIDAGFSNADIFPQSFRFRWNEDNFGQYKIIKKGDIIDLNERNYSLYRKTITMFEHHVLNKNDDIYMIDNQPISQYKFEYNYFFLLNDNHSNYWDSRVWGALPEYLIKGKIIKEF